MTACTHHFVLEPNGYGPTSSGRCKVCGEQRTFNNTHESVVLTPRNVKKDNSRAVGHKAEPVSIFKVRSQR